MTISYFHLLELVAGSHQRLVEAVDRLEEREAHAASSLPGWTRGHVITHLARNADAHWRMLLGAAAGTRVAMYPGGREARGAAIEEGSGRPLALLQVDLRFSCDRLLQTLRSVEGPTLEATVAWRVAVPVAELPILRLLETEVHHGDLDVGYQPDDWPEEFVSVVLDRELAAARRNHLQVALPDLSAARQLAWLLGRSREPGIPAPPSWPFDPPQK